MRLKNRHIVILGHAKFDASFESTGYNVAKYLARDNFVYYAEHPFTWRDYFKFLGKSEHQRRKAFFFSKKAIQTEIPGLKVIICPPVLPINFIAEGRLYRWLLKINNRIVGKRINAIVKQHTAEEVIFINIFNFHFPEAARYFRHRLRIYYSVDPMITAYDIKHGIISENKLVAESDFVICSSKKLLEDKLTINPNCYFVPNAADIRHSSKALSPSLPPHPLLAEIPKPIVGYFGHIERRMDYLMLKEIIDANKSVSFVFAGHVSEDYFPAWFKDMPNAFFTGSIPYEEMPAMVKGFDVAIIPFKKDEVSRTIFPLKLFEYLGAGRPVICTDFNPDLKEFTGDTVLYCGNATAFSEAIQEALQQDKSMVGKRLAVAENNTWDIRIKEIYTLIETYLNGV